MSYTAGIVKLNMQGSSTKKSASSSMAVTTRSTSASSAMSRTGSLFGIYAQRSTTGLGLHNNYLAYNSSSTSALRHSLNDNRPIINNNIGFVPVYYQEDSSSKFLNIMAGISMGAGVLGTILNGVAELKAAGGGQDSVSTQTQSENKKEVTSPKSQQTSKSDIGQVSSESVSSMQSATSSSELRAAISSAQSPSLSPTAAAASALYILWKA